MNKKLILLPIVAMMLVGCGSKKKDPEPVPTPTPTPTEETADVVITAGAISAYKDELAEGESDPGYLDSESAYTVGVLSVTYNQVGFYGHNYSTKALEEAGGWLQFRNKNNKLSALNIESSKPIKSVKIVLPESKDAYDNTNCWDAKFGTDATYAVETKSVDTVAGTKEYVITPSASTNKFFQLIQGTESHTHYAKSVTITYIK